MDDRELDALLNRAGGPTSVDPAVSAATRDAVSRTRAARRPRPNRLLLGGALLAGALALTAGSTLTAYYLRIPPFQGLPEGSLRTVGFIPLDYVTDEGHAVQCRTFLEFENVDAAGVARVDAAIAEADWSAWGQGMYDGLENPLPQPDAAEDLGPQEDMNDLELDAVYEFARGVIPELGLFGANPGGPTLSAVGSTCIPYGPGATSSPAQP